jgi:hypothetical protein
VRRENSTLLYLSNVFTEDMNDEDLAKAVKNHGREIGVRIMTVDIVHNRYCQDVIGCRIRVPHPQVAKTLEFDSWPDEIVCRKWERRPPRNKNNEVGYGGSDSVSQCEGY